MLVFMLTFIVLCVIFSPGGPFGFLIAGVASYAIANAIRRR